MWVTFLTVETPTGRVFGPVMRRKALGDAYEYREMTKEESAEYLDDDAW